MTESTRLELDETTAWADPDPGRALPFWSALDQDILAHIPPDQRPPRFLRKLAVVLRSSGLHVMLSYRLSHAARHHLGIAGRIVAALLYWLLRHGHACSIASSARIHGGVILPHPQGIVIGAGVVIGPRAWIYQNVTLGGSPGKAGFPHVGSDARIYSGAVLAGPIRVGDNVLIGANAVLISDIPSSKMVRSPVSEVVDLPSRFVVDLEG